MSVLYKMPIDLYRDGDHYTLNADLPGIDPKSVDLDVDGQYLTIRAERVAPSAEGRAWLARENRSGSFVRRLAGLRVFHFRFDAAVRLLHHLRNGDHAVRLTLELQRDGVADLRQVVRGRNRRGPGERGPGHNCPCPPLPGPSCHGRLPQQDLSVPRSHP